MREGILLQDAAGIITYINPAGAEILGYAAHDLVGRQWSALVAPEAVDWLPKVDDPRPGETAVRYETSLITHEGRRLPAIVSGRPLFEGREFAGTLSAFTDISDRRQAEEALEESEQRLRTVLQHMP